MADEVESGERKTSIASDSPDHVIEKDSPEEQNQGDIGNAESVPTDWKVWTEEETRTLIQVYKSCSSKYPENYSRKLLFQEIAQDLKNMGYVKGPERIRNRMKSLRTAYRRTMDYNATHILKKNFVFLDDLSEIYNVAPALSDDNDTSSHSGYSMSVGKDEDSYSVASSNDSSKKLRIVRASQTVKPKVEISKPTTSSTPKYTSLRKKIPSKKTIFPLFQCGQCYGKFSASQELHNHNCQNSTHSPQVNGTKQTSVEKRKNGTSSQNSKAAFQWTGVATLQFLTLLKGYQSKLRNSHCNNGNLINDLSTAMKKRRLQVSPEELKKKWRCLAANYEKTLNYNERHQDQKKCAFYNRLTELYGFGVSLDMFEYEEPVKMTVEVSPFSISTSETQQANYSDMNHENGYFPKERLNFMKNEGTSVNHSSDLVVWLDSFWKEWKEIERKREQVNAERHIELMEILACLAENMAK